MKLLLIVLTLVPAAAVYSSSEFAREFGPSNDAGAVMSRLTSMMGASNQKLGLAERHHKKLVKKIRNEAAAFLQAESSIYGTYLNNYAAELTQSIDDLENAVLVAKVALAKAEAASSSPNDWRDPDLELRARLGAKVAAAERTVKKAQRTRAREVQEAEDRSEEAMEDEAQKLGMKVGDMTPLIDEAKKTLETTVSKLRMPMLPKGLIDEAKKTLETTAKEPAHVKVAGKAITKTAVTAKVNLKALEDNVAQATKNNLAKTKDANKKLEGFLSKTDKDVAVKTAKIQQELEQRQTTELEKILGQKRTEKKVAATKQAIVTKKVAKNVVPAKVAVKAEKKVAATKKATVAKTVAKKAAVPKKAAVATKAVAAKVVAKASPAKVAVKAVLAAPKTSQHAKEDAMQMWAVADMELRESQSEEVEASDALADAKAIEEVAADKAKVDKARAGKELKGTDLEAALAVARDEEASKDRDAKQIEDVGAKEQKDAVATRKEAEQVRHDATNIESADRNAANEIADAKEMKLVADIEEKEAAEESHQAHEDKANGRAIEQAAALTDKADSTTATKEQEKRELDDAKNLEDVAAKEDKDAADTMKDATRMRKDAEAIEAVDS